MLNHAPSSRFRMTGDLNVPFAVKRTALSVLGAALFSEVTFGTEYVWITSMPAGFSTAYPVSPDTRKRIHCLQRRRRQPMRTGGLFPQPECE